MRRGIAFVRIHPFVTILIVLLGLGASFTIAQISEPPRRPASFLPEGALVYAEAKDLEGLLEWWKDSDVRSNWEQSANYEQFQNSRLYLKLKDRMAKWGAGGNFRFRLENLIQAAGDRSAVAIYDIGELKAIGATRLAWEEAKTTELWLAKARFQERTAANHKYYVEPRDGALSFAYVEPYLIASTEETLLVRVLANFEQPNRTLEQSGKWSSFQNIATNDVSLFLDQEALQQNRYFQKYWIHRNVKDFADIQATWIDLTIQPDAILEHRYFARGNTDESGTAENSGVPPGWITHLQQFRHESLWIDAPVDAPVAAKNILSMVNRLPNKDQRASFPPAFSGSAERATRAETRNILLEQIDEPILQVKSETLLNANQEEELTRILQPAGPAAQIRLAYPLWDNQALFVRFPQTVLLQLKDFPKLNQQAFLEQMLQHFLLLHATQDAGGRWQAQGNGTFALQSFRPLYVQFRDPWIVIANEESDFKAITANLPAASAIVNGSYRYAIWKQGRWKYTRLTQRLDHGTYRDDVPLLFSENLTSLLTTLDPIAASSVSHTAKEEMIRYELK